MLGTHRVSRESILPILPELLDAYEETKVQRHSMLPPSEPVVHNILPSTHDSTQNIRSHTINVERDSVLPTTESKPDLCPSVANRNSFSEKEHSPLRKRLDSMFSPGSNDDSFVANETLMANDESVLATTSISGKNDESILATTLVDDTDRTVSNSPSNDANDETAVANQTVMNSSNESDNEVLNFLKLMDSMIEKNTQSVTTYLKQVEELKSKIDSSNKEIEDIRNMKRILVEKFKVKSLVSEKENIVPTKSSLSELVTKPVTPTKLSPGASPSKQIIQEMRSTFKFLKTPRLPRAPRSSVLLTPHSMSFCIKSQYEQLLE